MRLVTAVEHVEQAVVGLADRAFGAPPPPAGAARVPPGPAPRRGRVLGSLGYYLRFYVDPLGFVAERFERYGDIYYAPSADGGLYALRHPDHLYEVLVTRAAQFDKTHSAFRKLSEVLGGGLLNSDGERWKRHRRMIQPAFGHARVAGYAAAMVDEAERASARFRDGEEHDVDRAMMELTLAVVCRALFSRDASGDAATVGSAMGAFQARLTAPDLVPAWLPSPRRRRVGDAIADLDRIVYDMIAARRTQATPPEPPDLLHMLVTAIDEEGDGGRLTETEVRDELVTLLLAGHETTSNALTWMLYLLSQHSEAEARLHAELDRVLGGRAPALADLDLLPYTEQVVKEAMRLYPPVFVMARQAREDTEIGGYPVPRGSEVVLWIYRTHHDPRWYPDPEAFRPERFAPGEEANLPRLAYAPFGAGPRTCIGKSFAMIEARLLLAVLAQRFRFTLAPGQRVAPAPRITLGPRYGMRMRVHRRAAATTPRA
jgi:cytochrome P450